MWVPAYDDCPAVDAGSRDCWGLGTDVPNCARGQVSTRTGCCGHRLPCLGTRAGACIHHFPIFLVVYSTLGLFFFSCLFPGGYCISQ